MRGCDYTGPPLPLPPGLSFAYNLQASAAVLMASTVCGKKVSQLVGCNPLFNNTFKKKENTLFHFNHHFYFIILLFFFFSTFFNIVFFSV